MTAAARVRAAAWVTITGALLAVVAGRFVFLYEPYTFLVGDSNYYAETAISIIMDHDLDLRNQLKGGLEAHDGQIALGLRGEWYPKHPLLMPAVTLPLLPLLGMNAFLVFNVFVLLGLGVTLYEIASLTTRPLAAVAGTLMTILGSFLILYDYNYSPNLFACLLLALTILCAARGRPAISGLFGGLSALAYTVHLVLLPVLLACAAWRRWRSGAVRFAAGAALPLIALGAMNLHMFGSPLVSSYTRALTLAGEGTVLHSNASDFDNPWWDGIRGQLLDTKRGLATTAPVLFVALPGYLLWLRARRDQALVCLAISTILFLLFSRYRLWPTSQVGNRFLMPLVAFSAPAVCCSVEWTLDRLTRRASAWREQGRASRGAAPVARRDR